jgi:hypothetical protein
MSLPRGAVDDTCYARRDVVLEPDLTPMVKGTVFLQEGRVEDGQVDRGPAPGGTKPKEQVGGGFLLFEREGINRAEEEAGEAAVELRRAEGAEPGLEGGIALFRCALCETGLGICGGDACCG